MNNWKETMRGVAMELGVETPVTATDEQAGKSGGQTFAIYVSAGRIYVQNAAGKVIDIGDLMEVGGIYGFRLDEGTIDGQGYADLGAALRGMADQLTFLYLKGLFDRLPDAASEASVHSVSVPAIHVTLADGTDELRP